MLSRVSTSATLMLIWYMFRDDKTKRAWCIAHAHLNPHTHSRSPRSIQRQTPSMQPHIAQQQRTIIIRISHLHLTRYRKRSALADTTQTQFVATHFPKKKQKTPAESSHLCARETHTSINTCILYMFVSPNDSVKNGRLSSAGLRIEDASCIDRELKCVIKYNYYMCLDTGGWMSIRVAVLKIINYVWMKRNLWKWQCLVC